MRYASRATRLLAATATFAMVAAGCGGDVGEPDEPDDGGAAPADDPATESATAPIDDDAAAAGGPTPPEGVVEFRQAEPGSGEGLKIGFTQLALSAGFPQDVQASVEEQAEIAGVELITCDSEFDAAKALDCARQFATQQVNGLITFQADTNAAPRICEAGPDVPVLAVDIEQQPCQTAFMGAANSYAGELVGYALGEHFQQSFDCEYDAFVSLESTQVGEVNDLRMGGMRDGFEAICGEIDDLRTIDTGAGGQGDVAQRQMADTLTALPGAERIIVVGINEDVIIGALAGARTQNRVDDLYLGVQNLNPDNCVIYEHPNWVGSVAYFPERYGEILVPYLVDAMNGEDIPSELLVPHEIVDRDNIMELYPETDCSL